MLPPRLIRRLVLAPLDPGPVAPRHPAAGTTRTPRPGRPGQEHAEPAAAAGRRCARGHHRLPAADVIFVAHAGLDQLVSVADVWRSLPMDQVVHAKWWRVPAVEVPRHADHESQVQWLYDWWQRLDTWITENRPAGAPDPR